MFDESFPDAHSTGLKRSSRGGATTDVNLIGLDVEAVVEFSRCGARYRPVFPLPGRHGGDLHHLET